MSEAAEQREYSKETNIQSESTNAEQTVGMQLKQTREAKGLTIDDVAAELRLLTANVLDIESSEYKKRIPMTFYRGYIRAYAKLLGLPSKELVDAFNAEEPVVQRQAQEQALPKHKPKRGIVLTEKVLKRSILGMIILTGLIYMVIPQRHVRQAGRVEHPSKIAKAEQRNSSEIPLNQLLEKNNETVG